MNIKKISRITIPSLILSFYLFSGKVYADVTGWIEEAGGVKTPLDKWFPNVINFAIGLAALVSVVVLIASGYMYITAAGDEAKIEKAGKSITYAVVGLVICFIAVILVNFVLERVLS